MATEPRPETPARNAAEAQPNPNDAAVDASAGTPHYAAFGSPEDATNAANLAAASGAPAPAHAGNDGSNDNPDEFSEFRTADQPATEGYSAQAENAQQAGAASYNGGRDQSNAQPEAFEKAEDVARAAFAADDPRYGSGKQSSWPSNEPAQENTDMKGGYDPAPKV